MKKINIHCRKCRKGLRMSYTPCGDKNAIVLRGIEISCPYCKRTMTLRNYTEEKFLENAVGDKFFI